MAKISPVSIKYIIHAKFKAEGTVEKPDVIGAIFGQTEGLLGDELEMRELQKEGKIGRIDVDLEAENGKTIGIIEVPSALDKAETTIIAAALETIERIGPSDAKIEVEKIEDVRGNKRDYIIERAKKLLEGVEGTSETKEIEEAVKSSSKISRLQEYGEENLPCGDISGEEVVVVEGRADVINMLKAGVKNVIAMNGTILPETIKELSLEKEITLFLDGDRGGKLIAKNAVNNARVDYVAFAPDGKEVEELTKKEILVGLRKKIPTTQFFEEIDKGYKKGRGKRIHERRSGRVERETETTEENKESKKGKTERFTDEEISKIREILENLTGTKGAVLLNKNLEIIKKLPLSQLYNFKAREVYTVIIDGVATAAIIKIVENLRAEHLVARNFAFTETNVDLVSL